MSINGSNFSPTSSCFDVLAIHDDRDIVAAAGRAAAQVQSKCRTQGRAEQKDRGFPYKYMAFVAGEFRTSRIYGGPTTVLTAKTARRNSIHVIRHYYLDVDLQFFTAVLGSDFDLGNFSCGN